MASSLPRRALVHLVAVAVAVALPPAALALGDPFAISLATRILIYALAAASLDLALGYGGMVSFGHGAFLGIGAYVVGVLGLHHFEETAVAFLPGDWTGTAAAALTWPLAVIVAGLLALAIGALSLRTSGVYFIMITLAFAQMLHYFFVALPAYGGADGVNLWQRSQIPGLDLYDDVTFYYVCLALLVGYLMAARRLVDSRFGMVIRAGKQNERRLQALGVPTYRYKLLAFAISGAGVGLAGALIANHTEFVGPDLMHWSRSGEIMIMVILGGMGTLVGPVFGAVCLLLLEEVLAGYTEHWMAVLGLLLVAAVLFARRGVYGWLVGRESGDG